MLFCEIKGKRRCENLLRVEGERVTWSCNGKSSERVLIIFYFMSPVEKGKRRRF